MASKISSLLGVLALVLLTGCPLECVEPQHAFEIDLTMYPQKEIYYLGDTIWIKAESHTSLYDAISGDTIDYTGTELVAGFRVGELIRDLSTILDAAHHFDVIYNIGLPAIDGVNELNTNRSRYFTFIEDKRKFLLDVGLECKKTGIYTITSYNAPNVGREGSRCESANISYHIVNDEKNLHYLQTIYYQGQPLAQSDLTNGYCFQVVK